jgi:formylglycine-generating enzyme required for sulfatase activity
VSQFGRIDWRKYWQVGARGAAARWRKCLKGQRNARQEPRAPTCRRPREVWDRGGLNPPIFRSWPIADAFREAIVQALETTIGPEMRAEFVVVVVTAHLIASNALAQSSNVTPAEPLMVEIAGGEFLMGSGLDERNSWNSERPQHRVSVPPFQIASHEVTFDEWDVCVADHACDEIVSDEGWGRGRRPVINVQWQQAQTYAAWLSRRTGKAYRLPTEAEWEYAARAGTETPYWWGTQRRREDGAGVVMVMRTWPVGSYPANPWGLYDVSGNAPEWVQDCWHRNYEGAPADGSAWADYDCTWRVFRGDADYRLALRSGTAHWARVGFRLAMSSP